MKIINKVLTYIKKRDHIKYARSLGVEVGKNCEFVDNPNFGSEPYLVKIGNHVLISGDVTFLNHDGSLWVIKNNDEDKEKYKDTFKFGRIEIGNNCFIGHRSMILPNVIIGDNCIVAAGSIVTKCIPSGEVWGGVPARFIMKTQDFADKCYKNKLPINREDLIRNKKGTLLRIVK